MRMFVTTIWSAVSLVACTIQKAATKPIPVKTIYNYVLSVDTLPINRYSFQYIQNQTLFQAFFTQTKTSYGAAPVPNFDTESVIVIIGNPTDRIVSIAINKSYVQRNVLKIDFAITDTTKWKTYKQVPLLLAVVKKIPALKKVEFFRDGQKVESILTESK